MATPPSHCSLGKTPGHMPGARMFAVCVDSRSVGGPIVTSLKQKQCQDLRWM